MSDRVWFSGVELSGHLRDVELAADSEAESVARGPVHTVAAGRYYAVVRDGVPMIERADTVGAVLHVEETLTRSQKATATAVATEERP